MQVTAFFGGLNAEGISMNSAIKWGVAVAAVVAWAGVAGAVPLNGTLTIGAAATPHLIAEFILIPSAFRPMDDVLTCIYRMQIRCQLAEDAM